jgi:hypothetical protein
MNPPGGKSRFVIYIVANAGETKLKFPFQRIAGDPSKLRRDEVHWAFCIPSSCQPEDLTTHLEDALSVYTQQYGFVARVDVDKDMCTVNKGFNLSTGDIITL